MEGSAVEKIAILAKSEIKTIGGFEYHVSEDGCHLVRPPLPEPVKCFSLGQFTNSVIAMVKDNADGDRIEINVEDFNRVVAMDWNRNETLQLQIYSEADVSKMFNSFPFGQKLSQEEFIINVMTKFVQDEQTSALLRLVSSIKAERINTSDDDGYSQTAQTKAGVTLVSEKKVQNLWSLRTYKTFPEMEQPVIPYILRLHQRADEMPTFALYDCDGGAWKMNVAYGIREWLINRLKTELGESFQYLTIL